MANVAGQADELVAGRAARIVLDAEAERRLTFPGSFLGRAGPCARAEAAVAGNPDLRVRAVARSVHERAQEASACMHTLERLLDHVAALQFPHGTPNAATDAAERAQEALDEAKRAVDEMVEELHAGLWRALPPNQAEESAASLLRVLELRARQTEQAVDGRSASASCQDWHRAADLVAWWSRLAPDPFRQAGMKEETHLRPPSSPFVFREFLDLED